jgi:RNA polymerase sigma-70 factor (ECF subfamily)
LATNRFAPVQETAYTGAGMRDADSTSAAKASAAAQFATTHWSVVLAAGEQTSPESDRALAELCEAYWFPLYAFTRRQGYGPPDAQDLTQGFFSQLLEKSYLGMADPSRGRFRSFLLASLKHYLANEWDRKQTAKRGGNEIHVSFDEVEVRYGREPGQHLVPELLFDRQWALSVLDQALVRLRAEFAAADKARLFDRVKGCLSGENISGSYAQLAAGLGMSEGALKVTVHRMRVRFRELIRGVVAQTLANPGEVEEELRYLITVLSD